MSNELNVDYLVTENEYLGKICKALTESSQHCTITDSCTIITLIAMLAENFLSTDDDHSIIRMERAYNEEIPLCENIIIDFSIEKFCIYNKLSEYTENNGKILDINNLSDIGVISKKYSLKYKNSFDDSDDFLQNIINDLVGFIVVDKIDQEFKTKIIIGNVGVEVRFKCSYDKIVYH